MTLNSDMPDNRISLNGKWEFRLDKEEAWSAIEVPGCWENLGIRKDHPGPAWYRKQVIVPEKFLNKRLWLCCGGVSYHAIVFVNGIEIGSHTGIWDGFRLEITNAVTPSQPVEILLKVEKPASLTNGPDSEAVSGRFPMKETLSGFLPYVWGHIFGGIWQSVWLEASGKIVFEDILIRGDDRGNVHAEICCSEAATVNLEIFDADENRILSKKRQEKGKRVEFTATVPSPKLWSPEQPILYKARVSAENGETRTLKFGFRSLGVQGSTLYLNGKPLYPRMVLSWGWYRESLNSNPGPDRIRRDLERLKQLGYNSIKLCLWVPPQYYFDLADELGMLLWLELPMWLPKMSANFRKQTPLEYERIVRQVRNHPSLILYTLGCELNREVDAEFLKPLYATIKNLIGDALLRDNSGSGEAYGGLLNEFADYYDYHFYSDIQFLRQLFDFFSPRWRSKQPWLFGEFCDSDTFRDLRLLYAANHGKPPWWTLRDEQQNPQGARWAYDVVDQETRLRQNGFWERGEELQWISHQQALLHRKFTLEFVRTYREISGYVVTNERDTPISTAGMLDDFENLKFDPGDFRPFNQDLVLALGWDKRRRWQAGGDRAAYWDTRCYRGGENIRAHIIASHFGKANGLAKLTWEVAFPGQPPFAKGVANTEALEPGAVREIHIAEFIAPDVKTPLQADLVASVQVGKEVATNKWPLWFFPAHPRQTVLPISIMDPQDRLEGLNSFEAVKNDVLKQDQLLITTLWTDKIQSFVTGGGRAIYLHPGKETESAFSTEEIPFWREAIKVIEPHPAWGDFPHEGWVNLQFYGLATDHALDTAQQKNASPILRRLDARTMQVHDYATECFLGKGRVIVSTLRFEGGLGDQPSGIEQNPAALYLLNCWVRYLGNL